MGRSASSERYSRQIILKEFGETGQQKLKDARVLVIGAGGLGCPALQYLAGAGIGTIGIADYDIVTLSNLHRQLLYSTDDIGLSKVLRAGEILELLNPEIDIITFNERLTNKNSLSIISEFDIILDGTDNFASRYLINDACVISGKTLVYGAISRYEGQIAIFNCIVEAENTPVNYRDLFPEPPAEGEILNCEEAGVIGVLPGIIGIMMANETLKLLTGIGTPLINRLLTYNSLDNQSYEMELQPRAETRSLIPAGEKEFKETDYQWFCSASPEFEIEEEEFNRLLGEKEFMVIDVREQGELPLITEFECTRIPLSRLDEQIASIEAENVIFFCQSGKRSLTAAKALADLHGSSKKIYSLKGGILNWMKLKRV